MEHMTEDELMAWEDRHDEVVLWALRWTHLTFAVCVAGVLTLIFTEYLLAGIAFVAMGFVGLIAQKYYARKHQALHEEMGDVEE